MTMLTIFTPTYNRKDTLERLYLSLVGQSGVEFEWIIVDDGSEDNTGELVESWREKSLVNITYMYKENSGKQRAYNDAIEISKSKLFICIDSDDMFAPNALSSLVEVWNKIGNKENLAGMTYLSVSRQGKVVGTPFPEGVPDCTLFDVYNKHNVTGDKGIIFNLSVLKKFRFPTFNGEKFIPEALLYNRIGKEFVFRHLNLPLQIVEYQSDGLSASYQNLLNSNPKGVALYYKELSLESNSIRNIAKSSIYYVKYTLISGRSVLKTLFGYGSFIQCFIFFPVGLYLYLKFRIGK